MTRALCAILLAVLTVLSIAAAASYVQPATISITTDGTSSSIEVSGGDVGYPGPSEVVIERDVLGLVIVSRTRLLIEPQRVYLPQVSNE